MRDLGTRRHERTTGSIKRDMTSIAGAWNYSSTFPGAMYNPPQNLVLTVFGDLLGVHGSGNCNSTELAPARARGYTVKLVFIPINNIIVGGQ